METKFGGTSTRFDSRATLNLREGGRRMSRLDDVAVEAIRQRVDAAVWTVDNPLELALLAEGSSSDDVRALLADRDALVAELEALQVVLQTQREYWAASDAFDQAVKDEDYGSLMGVALRRFHVAKDAARALLESTEATHESTSEIQQP